MRERRESQRGRKKREGSEWERNSTKREKRGEVVSGKRENIEREKRRGSELERGRGERVRKREREDR